MAKKYPIELCRELMDKVSGTDVLFKHRPTRYETGTVLSVDIRGLLPAVEGKATLLLEKFLGGGFAGQVYRCRLESLEIQDGENIQGLNVGGKYAVKIIIPPTGFSRAFRNAVYWIAYQGPFSAQVNYGACRSGLIWQKLLRSGAKVKFGRENAIKDAYATFWDPVLGSYGEIVEWVEGRMWRLESDLNLKKRKDWRNLDLNETASKEFITKRRFMAGLVELMHEMGSPELARQYEWWTMKSQPNAIKRTDISAETSYDGLCAIDFRPGLALLPFLPMSPGDFKLILSGLLKRRALVQFDRCDLNKLQKFISENAAAFEGSEKLITELIEQDEKYRRSLPDITNQGLQLLYNKELRCDVRQGLIEGYTAQNLVDSDYAAKLQVGSWRFTGYYLLGTIPLLGKRIRRLLGNAMYRQHVLTALTKYSYLVKTLTLKAEQKIIEWLRAGRIGEERAKRLAKRPFLCLFEQLTLGLMPIPFLHRLLTDPKHIGMAIIRVFGFFYLFCRRPEIREQWFLNTITQGEKDGLLTHTESEEISNHARDPYITKYLKCVAAHFATLPLTQLVAVIIGGFLAAWMLSKGASWAKATASFGGVLIFCQVFPISPGSIARGIFVVYMMIKERNVKDYLIAAPLSFVKYIGYLAFPLQMTATYPQLARFMAGQWATKSVRWIPVFGEQGALFEHWIFDLFFNRTQMLGHWCKPRMKSILTTWLILGVLAIASIIWFKQLPLHSKTTIQLIILAIAVFIFPRLVLYPLLNRKSAENAAEKNAKKTVDYE